MLLVERLRDDSGLRAFGTFRAARVVIAGEAKEQGVQGGPALRVEQREQLVFEPVDPCTKANQLAPAPPGQADDVAAAIVRISMPLDQSALLQPIEDADELTAI